MIKSISYWSIEPPAGGGQRPIDQAMAEAAAAGFKAIELAVGVSGILNTETDQRACEQYRSLAEKHRLSLETVAAGITWGLSPTDTDERVRERSIAAHAAALQRAAWLGAKSMLMVPGAVAIPWEPAHKHVRYDRAVQWSKQAVIRLADTAEHVGVDLCVENVWNGMFYSPLELAQFVDAIGSSRVGIYFDVGNVLGYHQHPPHWIEILDKRIRRVHIKDFKKSIGTISGFCELLEGDVPWKETMAALRTIKYDKTMVAEMLPPKPGQLQRTSKAMDAILAM
ncbi:MAG TPA: sugar phosphate isomerase/epimerase family protein [Tepidisphaeraceae bacterium]|nr:sugar phosphate isomerase/epimerase family protein [Tepidisphaeraceae bacterium]